MLVLPVLTELLVLLEALVSLLLFACLVLILEQVFLPDTVLLILAPLTKLLSIWNVLAIFSGSLSPLLLLDE